ncbi:MAG: hypothetical protein Q8Q47_05690 [Ignavibacteriaceae bacterium]|nr:hypothetical protein [Ignavibacteriaceae bacterium]
MKILQKNIENISLSKNYFFSILKIILSILFFPLLHIIFIIIIILIDFKLLIFPLTYILSVFFEEYFHTSAIASLYPNIKLYFYKNYFLIYKYPFFTKAFGIQNLFRISSLNQIYVSLSGPLNSLFLNLLISPLILLISTQLFFTFLLVGTFIPLLSLIPKKFPVISDGYRIIKLSNEEEIKLGKKFWIDFILLEKKMFQDIIGK